MDLFILFYQKQLEILINFNLKIIKLYIDYIMFNIIIQTYKGSKTLEVESTDTIKIIKDKLNDLVELNNYEITFNGRILKNMDTLRNLDVISSDASSFRAIQKTRDGRKSRK